jgi:hypothetical protein
MYGEKSRKNVWRYVKDTNNLRHSSLDIIIMFIFHKFDDKKIKNDLVKIDRERPGITDRRPANSTSLYK